MPICKVKDCGREIHSRGFCTRCYMRFRTGLIDFEGKQLKPRYGHVKEVPCKICGELVGAGGSKKAELCLKHYAQRRRERIKVEKAEENGGFKKYDVYEIGGDLFSVGIKRDFGENKVITLVEPVGERETLFASVLPLKGKMETGYKKVGTIKVAD